LIRYHRDRDESGSTFSLNKKFYVFSQFSHFIRPGFQILDIDDKNSLAAYNPIQHRLVIVTINDHKQPFTATFDLSSFQLRDANAVSYRTSADENMQKIASSLIRTDKLTATLPPRSITTQVITGTLP
jgi:galactan endo-1,6-beta-galactosidase